LGSARYQPAIVGSLPTMLCLGKLPNTAGKLPALPEKMIPVEATKIAGRFCETPLW